MFLLFIIFFSLASSFALPPPSLSPPAGNSIHIQTKAANGVYSYRCLDNDWLPASAFATLVDPIHGSSLLGNYSLIFRPNQTRFVGTWTLLNDGATFAESGSPISLVSGKRIASLANGPGNLRQYLAEACFHEFSGPAALISYVTFLNSKGGQPPINGYCDDNTIIEVSFEGDFYLWRQDLVPPILPQELQLSPIDRPVEGLYAKGFVEYVFDGKKWGQRRLLAKIYNVPGGNRLGNYSIMPKPDIHGGAYCWTLDNPNGFQITGKNARNRVTVDPNSLPWSLISVTSWNGNMSFLGSYSHVHMVSTSGGLAPKTIKVSVGTVWRSSFSCIFWLYCSI